MSEKDLRPTRYLLSLRYAQEFVREFFEQNPISQLGVLGLRDGLAFRVSDMSGNPTEHITSIQNLRTQDPKGLPSLQNGLEMARGALLYASLRSPTLLHYPTGT
jgi:transcription initiation factor TFIIH subunit 2